MRLRVAYNDIGECSVAFNYDPATWESHFETQLWIKSRWDNGKVVNGYLKYYQFETLKAAVNKFDELCEKHGIH